MTHEHEVYYNISIQEVNVLLEHQGEHFNKVLTFADVQQHNAYVRAWEEISSKLEEVMAGGDEVREQVKTLIFLFCEEMIKDFGDTGFTDEPLFSAYDNVTRLEDEVPNAIRFSFDHDLTQMVIRAIERGAS